MKEATLQVESVESHSVVAHHVVATPVCFHGVYVQTQTLGQSCEYSAEYAQSHTPFRRRQP